MEHVPVRLALPCLVTVLACSPPPAVVDAGRPPVDAGPPRVVDGGLLPASSTGRIVVSQAVREVGLRTTVTSSVFARFVEVAAGTPNPCVERTEGACVVRVCNEGPGVAGALVSPGALTLEGLLPLARDGGVDAGMPDAGPRLLLEPTDAGLVAFVVGQRLFFGGAELTVTAAGAEVPPFTSPALLTPAQLTVSTPRCMPTCAAIPRDVPYRVAWANVSGAEVSVQLTTPQVTVTCTAPAEQAVLEVPPSVLGELTPTSAAGDATLLVLARTSVRLDAGSWDVTVSAETPTLLPVEVLP